MNDPTLENSGETIEARAAFSAYVMLAGIWVVLTVWLTIQIVLVPVPGLYTFDSICFIVALLWIAWLRGFRLRIKDGIFEYRDGFYRSYSCKLDDIKRTRTQWISWRFLWRAIKVPRMIIDVTDPAAQPIAINTKPFSRAGLASFRDLFDRK